MSVVDGPVPKHRQLREILLALVDADLPPDSAIPSERELVSRFRVSRATVREAVGRLVSEGRLYRVRVATDWLLDAILPRQAVQLGLVPAADVPLENSAPEIKARR